MSLNLLNKFLVFFFRTNKLGELTLNQVGEKVCISGWLEFKRGGFFTLRDSTGSCQIVCNIEYKLPEKESIVNVEGIVRARPEKDRNPKMKTGDIEVVCSNMTVLNDCKRRPFTVSKFITTKEETRMRYRYIDLRNTAMQRNLRLRSSFILKLRRFLCERRGFVDVETPTLFRRTPGGAKEFIVPTRKPGKFYSLPQSPQQYKQLLMVGGIDRYMQIAKCYRDEGAKADRQPEFTQLDLEMSFTNQDEIKQLVEDALVESWPEELSSISAPFPRISYHDAISLYGTDKPDTRYGFVVKDLSELLKDVTIFQYASSLSIRGICFTDGCEKLTSKQIKTIQGNVRKQHSLRLTVVQIGENKKWIYPGAQDIFPVNTMDQVNDYLGVKEGDVICLCANRQWQKACMALGKARTMAASYYEENGHPLWDKDTYNFLWVEDFPLFEIDDEDRLHSAHHPFTAPATEDYEHLVPHPMEATKVRGQHYDLVLNGSEIGGGSMRIHDAATQRYILEVMLKEDCSELEHLLEALESGCPPHGGIALGLDRLIAIMCDALSIRDVIAFPKSTEGTDLMTGAPCELSQVDLDTYKVSVTKKENTNKED